LIQEFLNDGFGVYLCTRTINQCLHEAGRAVAPVEDQLAAEINPAERVFADETTWKEGAVALWLWVFCRATVTLFLVGARSRQIIQNLLSSAFTGWLMSDGYPVYRQYLKGCVAGRISYVRHGAWRSVWERTVPNPLARRSWRC
jgi:hypothetical protein